MNDIPDPDAIKMFVGQIPKTWMEHDVRLYFEEFGRIYLINVLRDKVTQQSRGCCFITFYTRKSALDAQNACHNLKTLPGMNHTVQMKPADNENRSERKIFIGMISKKLNETDIRNIFYRFGLIEECSILRDANGQSRGCGFVTFASKACALNAIKNMHQSTVMEGCSSPIVVKLADTQREKTPKISTGPTSNMNAISEQATLAQKTAQLTLIQLLQQQANCPNQLQTSHNINVAPLSTYPSMQNSPDLTTLALLANLTANNVSAALNQSVVGGNSNMGLMQSSNFTSGGFSLPNIMTPLSQMTNSTTTIQPVPVTSKATTWHTRYSKENNITGPEGSNLFIYHLPQEFTDADLVQAFLTFGTVVSAKVFIDKSTNLSKCFGFVSYDNPLSAQLAYQAMNGFQVGSKRLKVQLKRFKEKPY